MFYLKPKLLFSDIIMKKNIAPKEPFGQRLARLRKSQGITQIELGKKIGVSQRVITYYERETKRPPAVYLPLIAKILHVTIDELLGVAKTDEETTARNVRMWKKLRRIEKLPHKDQKAVIHYIEALLAKQTTNNNY